MDGWIGWLVFFIALVDCIVWKTRRTNNTDITNSFFVHPWLVAQRYIYMRVCCWCTRVAEARRARGPKSRHTAKERDRTQHQDRVPHEAVNDVEECFIEERRAIETGNVMPHTFVLYINWIRKVLCIILDWEMMVRHMIWQRNGIRACNFCCFNPFLRSVNGWRSNNIT